MTTIGEQIRWAESFAFENFRKLNSLSTKLKPNIQHRTHDMKYEWLTFGDQKYEDECEHDFGLAFIHEQWTLCEDNKEIKLIIIFSNHMTSSL